MGISSAKIRTGILGGSFDPVHLAHTALARAAFERANLDEIFFVPARRAPLRDAPTCASDADRLAMLEIALAKFSPPHKIITCEMERDGESYSIDTAEYLTQKYPDRDFFWIIGSDHIGKLLRWKRIEELCKIITFICAARPDYNISAQDIPHGAKIEFIDFAPRVESSTAIRTNLKNGTSVDFMLDEQVKKYIIRHKLYQK